MSSLEMQHDPDAFRSMSLARLYVCRREAREARGVGLIAFIFARLQKGNAFAVRAVFDAAWGRAREVGVGEKTFNCEGF